MSEQKYLTALQYSQKVNKPFSEIYNMAKNGKIKGAIIKNSVWYIPVSDSEDISLNTSNTSSKKRTKKRSKTKQVSLKKNQITSMVLAIITAILFLIWIAPASSIGSKFTSVYKAMFGGGGSTFTGNHTLILVFIFNILALVISGISIAVSNKTANRVMKIICLSLLMFSLPAFFMSACGGSGSIDLSNIMGGSSSKGGDLVIGFGTIATLILHLTSTVICIADITGDK